MKKMTTYQLCITALFSALMCILGPMAVPIGPVPISLTNLVVMLAVFVIGKWKGTVSTVIYILLGAVGLPVFSGYAGGIGKLTGPTGGYIIGFIPLAIICGVFVEKWANNKLLLVVGMIVGTVVLYALGTVWFVLQMQCEVMYALSVCVFPFLIGDAIKIAISLILGSELRKRLTKLGLIG